MTRIIEYGTVIICLFVFILGGILWQMIAFHIPGNKVYISYCTLSKRNLAVLSNNKVKGLGEPGVPFRSERSKTHIFPLVENVTPTKKCTDT